MRYHSLSVSRASLPECFIISSEADDGEIMGIRHKKHLTEGIQFHPESIMTQSGMKLLENFIDLV
jgi:anthranilate/para-aminobenzoate synthase component II